MGDSIWSCDAVSEVKSECMVMIRPFLVSVCFATGALFAGSPTSVAVPGGEAGEGTVFDASLTGEWGGVRSRMAEKGLTVDLNGIYSFQGVAGGGLNWGHDVGNVHASSGHDLPPPHDSR